MAEIKTINYIPLADTTARENITTINENITTINENIRQLSDSIANVEKPTDEQVTSAINSYIESNGISAGLTENQIIALNEMFKVCAYTQSDVSTQYNAFKTAFGIGESGGEEEPDTPIVPDEPITPTVTLSSISATYNGGNVLVGTELTDLASNIVVTAKYSDGTSQSVTGYELSGSIVEGSNAITVSYQGKTTTFKVVGYVEQDEPTEVVNIFDKNTMVSELTDFNSSTYGLIISHSQRDLITIPIEISEDTWFCISNATNPPSGWKGYNPPQILVTSVELTTTQNDNAFVRKYYLANNDLKYGDDRTGVQFKDESIIRIDTNGIGVTFLVPSSAKYIYIDETHSEPEKWEKLMVEKGNTCHDYVEYKGV